MNVALGAGGEVAGVGAGRGRVTVGVGALDGDGDGESDAVGAVAVCDKIGAAAGEGLDAAEARGAGVAGVRLPGPLHATSNGSTSISRSMVSGATRRLCMLTEGVTE